MIRRESSETRFSKVSCQSEPCSRGILPFEVSKKNRNSRKRLFRNTPVYFCNLGMLLFMDLYGNVKCRESSETRFSQVSRGSEPRRGVDDRSKFREECWREYRLN